MKNIHILPTDKSSRLYLHSDNELQLRTNIIRTSEDYLGSNQHIYITSDEDINDSDYVITKYGRLVQVSYLMSKDLESASNPVVLTTDQDLINDGVQDIDDKFLEWFVYNPSCEEVEVNSIETNPDYKSNWENRFTYKIIIPKEEPKQLTDLEIAIKLEEIKREELKQETLEEVAKNYAIKKRERKHLSNREFDLCQRDFIDGAKWRQERMYSEEEVLEIIRQYALEEHLITSSKPDIWFEQFKKK